MARGKKTRDEDISAVIESKLLDPQKSLRDIAEETGVNYKVAGDIINSVPDLVTGSNKGETILETMEAIIADIAEITSSCISAYKEKEKKETLSVSDLKGLNEIAKNNFDRKQILTGKPTANLKVSGYQEYSTEDLLKKLEE